MINIRVILIFLILLLLFLMLYYDNTKEYFSDCIIYKKAPNVIDERYYNYGELQLLYNYFKTDDKELIKETYNDKKNKNILTETNIINLDKMNRQEHDNKKIVFNDLDPSNSDWSVCYFNDTTKKVFDTNIQPDNKVFFNRMKDVKPICDNITDLKTDEDQDEDQDEDIILLQIDCNNTNIDITNNLEPENVNITKIRIVKYDKTNRTIEPYEESNEFIKFFFTLDTNTLKFMPMKKQVKFYIFKNQFCVNKYEFERSNEKCFNINQLGFESINFLNNSAKFSISQSMEELNCDSETITSFDDVKDELKNKLLNKAKMDYKKCTQNIRADYTDDDEIYRSRNNNCVVPRTYLLNHCSYKECKYHKKSCDYEKDMKAINEYNDILNVDSYNDLDQDSIFYIKDNSEKHYNTCRKYINYNTDFYDKIEAIENDQTMRDKDLINFDNENLYTEFNLLENVSQDNCIYIFINTINKR
jgi:hypothetical protein